MKSSWWVAQNEQVKAEWTAQSGAGEGEGSQRAGSGEEALVHGLPRTYDVIDGIFDGRQDEHAAERHDGGGRIEGGDGWDKLANTAMKTA